MKVMLSAIRLHHITYSMINSPRVFFWGGGHMPLLHNLQQTLRICIHENKNAPTHFSPQKQIQLYQRIS